jgi:LacI family transcriptional regulator
MVTIVDVARAANVSRSTVSRALSGYGRIGDATREKVLAVAEELGYRPNDLARATREGRSRTIGLIVTDIANPFFAEATKAVANTAAELGYELLVADTNEDAEIERRATRVFAEKRIDGLIVVPAPGGSHDHLFESVGRPAPAVVLLDRRLLQYGVTSVTSDDSRAAAEAVALLASKGHTRIGMIDGNWTGSGFTKTRPRTRGSTTADRSDGFSMGMKRAGLPVRSGWMLYSSARELYAAQTAFAWMLRQAEHPTAIVTNNSDVALAVLTVCREFDLAIGADISMVTFDDANWAKAFNPPISVVSRPVAKMGEAAARELVAQIDVHPPSRPIVLPNVLIDRESVTAPRNLA